MTTYSYDHENRLISQNVDGNVTSFAYDGFGRKRRESRGVNPDVILNWDGDQMIVESSDLDPEAPSKAYYVADGVIYAENANLGSEKSRRDYAVDYLGSVTGLTAGSDASLSSVRRWSAYGKLLSGSSEPIGYFWTGNTGSRVYQSLGLNDNRARHYGRNIKQWITRDPLWPSELPYTYVGGNPVTRIDPSGETYIPILWLPVFCTPRFGTNICSMTPRGGCPNQTDPNIGPIDINKFSDPDKTGIQSCDPKNIDVNAINARIDYIERYLAELKSYGKVWPESSARTPGVIWAETRSCYTRGPNGVRMNCAISCGSNLASLIKNDLYKGKRDFAGIGCIACCLMVHENVHCTQAITGTYNGEYTPDKEVAGYSAELACLRRIKEGKKCSQI